MHPSVHTYDLMRYDFGSVLRRIYEIDDPAEWLRKIAPHVRRMVQALKLAAPFASPLLGEGDRYTVWVEGGWLQARRETGKGETDWHIVLARAVDPEPPVITEGTM